MNANAKKLELALVNLEEIANNLSDLQDIRGAANEAAKWVEEVRRVVDVTPDETARRIANVLTGPTSGGNATRWANMIANTGCVLWVGRGEPLSGGDGTR